MHSDEEVGEEGDDGQHHDTEPHGATGQTGGVHHVVVLQGLEEGAVGERSVYSQ